MGPHKRFRRRRNVFFSRRFRWSGEMNLIWKPQHQHISHMAMDQYLYIPFLGGWTSINPSYFDVHQGDRVLTHPHMPFGMPFGRVVASWHDSGSAQLNFSCFQSARSFNGFTTFVVLMFFLTWTNWTGRWNEKTAGSHQPQNMVIFQLVEPSPW